MLKKKKFWRTFCCITHTISTLRTWATERGQTDRQWKLWHKPIPSLPAQLCPQPGRLCHDPGDAFRYISHQHFHQQASFLQRSSQPQLCSEGRTRSPGSSSESVTGVLCSVTEDSPVSHVWGLCDCVLCWGYSLYSGAYGGAYAIWLHMQPDYDSLGRRSFLH